MPHTRLILTMLVTLVAPLTGCNGGDVSASAIATEPMKSLSDVNPGEWEALARRRIFFGHQSVGRNILAGVRAIVDREPAIELRLVESELPGEIEGPALIHANIGRNGEPESKNTAFARAIESGFGEGGDLAILKYCYVDVQPDTDVDMLFREYVEHIEALRHEYPELTVVHVTLPLKRLRQGRREWLNRMLGNSQDMMLHEKRHRYNELLRARYAQSEPIFDLAALESMHADGTPSSVRYRGGIVPVLAPEWTEDGAHLNEAAQLRVAEQFLILLARVSGDRNNSISIMGSRGTHAD